MVKQIKSTAKQRVIDFVKIDMEDTFTFTVKGTIIDAERFLHRMRVELSRLRSLVRNHGKVPKHFKMIEVSKTANVNGTVEVKLKKTVSPHDVSEEIEDAFKYVAGGDMIDG